ncbi:helix-turn-helix transcriptional regulator [uncultured Adlercreutzia sp.]|uniref:helix-turn-helix transcriptional regulator n=1 Tax=uncultured Adlercreutzia sp. TaxID=875803 RepID=UPI0025CCCF98|nr:helix-turn-helix transcriptional regulator [uncultured Adlercreutzia sp.]
MNTVGSGIAARLGAFWPMLAGIVCARTALIVACYGSYAATDDGLFTDGAMLACCLLFAVLLALFGRRRGVLSERVVLGLFVASVAVATGCSVALGAFDSTDQAVLSLGFALSVLSTLALSLCMFYWLRALRGADEVTAALYVFAAFMISAVVVYLLSFLPAPAQNLIGAALIVAQLAFLGPAAARESITEERRHRRARTFFTFARNHMQDGRFLMACTVGMGALSFVDGFLRGYPDGLPILFTPETRLANVALTLLVCGLLLALVIRRRQRVMTVGIFTVMALLASASLVLFGAFPSRWDIGAAVVNTLNVVICAYCWYVIIAFTSFGDRDPYLYAMAGWVICFGMRSVARMLLFFVYPLTGNDLFINSLLGALILVASQVVLIQFLLAEHGESTHEARYQDARNAEALRRAEAAGEQARLAAEAEGERALRQLEEQSQLTLKEAERDVANAREALAKSEQTLQQLTSHLASLPALEASAPAPEAAAPSGHTLQEAVRRMGEQFLLSSREVDVLALYAAGYTQKKVAEELFITPATAHTHIKRIYGKCGMHSRQEILEYLASYGS